MNERAQRAVLLALGIAAVVVFAWRLDRSAWPEVTRHRDDAYYYFVFVRSLLSGEGPCVTPGVPTSGVHTGWAALLTAAGALFGAGALPVVAQVLGLVLHGATALLVARLLPEANRFAARCAALVYLGNPFLLTEAQNGQETALACFAMVVLLGAVRHGELRFAVVACIATLCRSDLLLLVAALAVSRHRLSVRALIAPLAALAVLVIVDLALAGHWLQDSAAPIPWLFEQHFLATDPSVGDWLRRLWWWLRPCLLGGPWAVVSPVLAAVLVWVAVSSWLPARARAIPLVLVVAGWGLGAADVEVPLLAALLIAGVSIALHEDARRGYLALLFGWGALMVLHFVLRHYPRPYYFAPMGVALVAGLGVATAVRPRLGAVLALVVVGLQVHDGSGPSVARTWQHEHVMAARHGRPLVGAGEPIGCFNAGLVAWVDPGPVHNLDGVVNRPAFEALQRGDLNGYLDQHGIRFLLDNPVQFMVTEPAAPVSHASGRHFASGFDPDSQLREIARFDVSGADAGRFGTDSFRLYWRVGRGEPPVVPVAPADLGPAPVAGRHVRWPAAAGDRLYLVGPGGDERELYRAPIDTVVFLLVPTPAPGRYILHGGAADAPLLVLQVP